MEHSNFPPTNAEMEIYFAHARSERSQAFADFCLWIKGLVTGHSHPATAPKTA